MRGIELYWWFYPTVTLTEGCLKFQEKAGKSSEPDKFNELT